MFLLDTNVVSELRKSRSGIADPGVSRWASEVPAALMFVSVISMHELEHGVLLAERSDPAKGEVLIGATALVYGMVIVTRNIGDFERFAGLEVLNPWQ